MDLIVKQVIKILSLNESGSGVTSVVVNGSNTNNNTNTNNSTGNESKQLLNPPHSTQYELSHLVKKLPSQALFAKVGGEKALLARLKSSSSSMNTATSNSNNHILVEESKKDGLIYLRLASSALAKETNEERRLNLYFKEDKSNKSLYYLYRLILNAGTAGITYNDLAVIFNSRFSVPSTAATTATTGTAGQSGPAQKGSRGGSNSKNNNATSSTASEEPLKKLDITNVSHYCRKLFALKFINILSEKVCKIAIAVKFADKSLAVDLRIKRKTQQQHQLQNQIQSQYQAWQFLQMINTQTPQSSQNMQSQQQQQQQSQNQQQQQQYPIPHQLSQQSASMIAMSLLNGSSGSGGGNGGSGGDDGDGKPLAKLAIVSDPWKFLREDTFILKELTFTQNILLNFSSYEAYAKEGLLQTEIAQKIHKLGERKMLVRSLETILNEYEVTSAADRHGRTFSLKFHIKSPHIANYIDNLMKEGKINIKQEIENLQKQLPITPDPITTSVNSSELKPQQSSAPSSTQISQQQQQILLSTFFRSPPSSKGQQSNSQTYASSTLSQSNVSSSIHSSSGQKVNQQTKLEESKVSASKSSVVHAEQQQTIQQSSQVMSSQIHSRAELFKQNPKLNKDSFDHIFNYFYSDQRLVSDLLKVGDQDFVRKCMLNPPSEHEPDYTRFSEMLLKVINETVEFTYVRQNKQLSNDTFASSSVSTSQQTSQLSSQKQKQVTKKQISRNKLNRYIIILNRIAEKKVIKTLKLKKHIIALEKNQGVGEIDKKTLEYILNTFAYIKYIYIIKKDIHIKTIKQNIVRSIIVHHSLPLTNPRVIKAEKTIKKGLLKQGQHEEEEGHEEFSESDSDSMNFLQTSSQMNSSQYQQVQQNMEPHNLHMNRSNKQTDITSYLLRKKRKVQPERIYYYDEEDDEDLNKEEDVDDEQGIIGGGNSQTRKDQTHTSTQEPEITKKFKDVEGSGAPAPSKNVQPNLIQSTLTLKQALSQVSKANCEVSAAPHKLRILASVIFQFTKRTYEKNMKACFEKMNVKEDYSVIFTNQYFNQSVDFKYPSFQRNLCQNLANLTNSVLFAVPSSSSIHGIDSLDYFGIESESIDSLLKSAFALPQEQLQLQHQQSEQPTQQLHQLPQMDIEDALKVEEQQQQVNNDEEEEGQQQLAVSKAEANTAEVYRIKSQLEELRGKDIRNVKPTQQDNILKFKSYLLRNPYKRIGELKLRFQMIDYFAFLTHCVLDGSITLFKLADSAVNTDDDEIGESVRDPILHEEQGKLDNQMQMSPNHNHRHASTHNPSSSYAFQKVRLEDVTASNIDDVFISLTSNYYHHFNL